MNTPERSRQQLDPVGNLGSRVLAVFLCAVAFAYAVIQTLRTYQEIVNPLLAVLALLWFAAACFTIIVGTSARRAPFTRASHVVVHLLAIGAIALTVASQWGANRLLQDDFGPVSLGILMLAIGSYRPATELAAAGTLSAVFVGFLTLLQVPTFASTTPPVSFVLVAMAPILALSYASAAYSGGLVEFLERWQRGAVSLADSRANATAEDVSRSIHQEQLTILDRDVLPFFGSILERDSLTPIDRERAQELGEAIRSVMVEEANRTWLELVVAQSGNGFGAWSGTIVDPDGSAAAMSTEQRTALRALLVALTEEPTFDRESLQISLDGDASRCTGELTATLNSSEAAVRPVLSPYLAVLRVVFQEVQFGYLHGTLTLKFTYEQR